MGGTAASRGGGTNSSGACGGLGRPLNGDFGGENPRPSSAVNPGSRESPLRKSVGLVAHGVGVVDGAALCCSGNLLPLGLPTGCSEGCRAMME